VGNFKTIPDAIDCWRVIFKMIPSAIDCLRVLKKLIISQGLLTGLQCLLLTQIVFDRTFHRIQLGDFELLVFVYRCRFETKRGNTLSVSSSIIREQGDSGCPGANNVVVKGNECFQTDYQIQKFATGIICENEWIILYICAQRMLTVKYKDCFHTDLRSSAGRVFTKLLKKFLSKNLT